jgi:polyisoprenoid-binding protein YceI
MSEPPAHDAPGRDAATIPAGTYQVDPARSELKFRAKAFGLMWVRGRIPVTSGTIRITEGQLEGSGEIGAAEIDTGLAARDWHLRTSHYLHTAPTRGSGYRSREPISARPGQTAP